MQAFDKKNMENTEKKMHIILCSLLSITNPADSSLCVTICSNSHVLITFLFGLI